MAPAGRAQTRKAREVMGQRIAVLGTGKMGEALVSACCAGKPVDEVLVTARRSERAAEPARARYGVEAVGNLEAAKRADTLILTVKPQDMGTLLLSWPRTFLAGPAGGSGAAGITTAFAAARLVCRGCRCG